MTRILLLCSGAALLTGCAAGGPSNISSQHQQDCVLQLTVDPQSATADHTAKPPGNQVNFQVMYGPSPASACRIPTSLLMNATWTNSDPADVQINSVPGTGNGTATCIGTTSSPATLTASYTPPNGTVQTASATLGCN
jgi:hypothetical protein